MKNLITFLIFGLIITVGKTQAGISNNILPEVQKVLCEDSRSSIRVEVCSTYTSPSGKYVWATTGTYLDTIKNAAGCDSFMRIFVVVGKHSNYQRKYVCDSFRPPSGKKVWYTSGIHRDTIKSVEGCDSILNYILTVGAKRSINISACTFYESPSGRHTWTKTGIYTDTLTSYFGCDSIITIDLTINKNYKYRIVDKFFKGFSKVSLACSDLESKLRGDDPLSSGTWRSDYPGLIKGDSFFAKQGPFEKEFYIYYDYDAFGCKGTDSLNIMIQEKPEVEIINSDTSICNSGDPIKISIKVKTKAVTNLEWIPILGGEVKPTAGDSIQFIPKLKNDTSNFSIIIVRTNPTSACVYMEDRLTISINPYPEIEISKNPEKSCGTKPIQFNAQILNRPDKASLSYEWCFPNEDYSNKKNPIRSFVNGGKNIYQVTVTSKHGCKNTIKDEIDVIHVNNKISLVNGTLYADNKQAGLHWLNCDTNYEKIPDEVLTFYTPSERGNYAVEVEEKGCIDTSECLFVDVQEPFKLISGNPSTGPIKIITPVDIGLVSLKLINSEGKMVFNRIVHSEGLIEINPNVKKGVYVLQMQSEMGDRTIIKILRF